MPFDWMHPARVARPQRREEVYRRELEDRAALLFRLGYDRSRARARLRANVDWDFEVGGARPPLDAHAIDALLEGIYRRGGVGAGEPSV
jgi:hypothetical protein